MLNGAFPHIQRMRMVGTVLLFHRPLSCCVVSAYVASYLFHAASLQWSRVNSGRSRIDMILISSCDEISSVARNVDEKGTRRKSRDISREKCAAQVIARFENVPCTIESIYRILRAIMIRGKKRRT